MGQTNEKELWRQQLGRELPFLTDCRVHNAYLLLLALATSQTDIERLHDLLPDNCQLFDDQLPVLRQVRAAMFDHKPPSRSIRPSDHICSDMFGIATVGHDLTAYYYERLMAEREVCELTRVLAHHQVLNQFDVAGYACHTYQIQLFGYWIAVEVILSATGPVLGIQLQAWQKELTRDLTQAWLRNPALMALGRAAHGMAGGKGVLINVCLVTPADSVLPFLDVRENHPDQPECGTSWIVHEDRRAVFVETIHKQLCTELGLNPGQDLGPLTPVAPWCARERNDNDNSTEVDV